jgi:hypothetical protein
MAHHQHLPIYKKALDVAVYFEKIVKNFSRYNNYILGAQLRIVSKEGVGLIIKANPRKERPMGRRRLTE